MALDFELILTLATFLSGIIWLIDSLCFAGKRQAAGAKMPVVVEYARSFFPVLLVVLLLRSFLVEPYRIPSGSDKPTLLVGDFILVNKFTYGLRLPVLHTKIWQNNEPQRGDIAIFRYPVNPSVDFIKRIIGVPGDTITYTNKVLYINGKEAPQTLIGQAMDTNEDETQSWPVSVYEETLPELTHKIYINSEVPVQDFSLVVPPGEYFAMGENRDNSNDSRYWGFVPEANFVGKAMVVLFSWDNDNHTVRWGRSGTSIK